MLFEFEKKKKMPDAQNAFRKVSQNKRMDVILKC